MTIFETMPIEFTIAEPTGEEDKEIFDFNAPEDVLIEVHRLDDEDWEIESCTVIRGKQGVTGAASYDQAYGAGLAWTLHQMLERLPAGYHVVVGITGSITRGDGWETDDDMDFEFESVRPATDDEKAMA